MYNVHYAVLYTCPLNAYYGNFQFDQVIGHVRDPSSNSMLLLTTLVTLGIGGRVPVPVPIFEKI